MAGGSQKQYSAVFSIGAKMLGSFRGVMAQAQARMQKLRESTMRFGESFLKVFERFGVGLSLFAGFAAGKIFQSIFEGASERASAAESRALKLSILLLQHNEIRKRGLGFAQKQAELIFKANEGLAKQGVLSQETLDAASAQLAVYGFSPKKIAAMIGPMSDVLVTMRTVKATAGDAVSLSEAWGRAVKGMVKPMKTFGFFADQKAWSKKSMQERNQALMKWADGLRGANLQAAATPAGKVQQMRNAFDKLSEDIGTKMLPAQAEMAKAWLNALPTIQPAVVGGFKWLLQGVTWLAGKVKNNLIPALHELANFVKGPLANPLARLKAAFDGLSGKAGAALVKLFGDLGMKGKDLKGAIGSKLIELTNKLADGFNWLAKNADKLKPYVYGVAAAVGAYNLGAGIATLLNPFTALAVGLGAVVTGVFWLNDHLAEIQKRQDVWGSMARGLQTFDTWLKPFVDSFKTNFVQAWVQLGDNMKAFWDYAAPVRDLVENGLAKSFHELGENLPKLGGALKTLGSILLEALLAPIKQVREAWDSLVSAFQNRPDWMKGPSAGSDQRGMPGYNPVAPAAAAASKIPAPPAAARAKVPYAGGMATGGIIRGHSLLQVAERGPEAIIPLSGGPRAEGLLHYASRAMGLGGITNNSREIHVTMSPITINGNVGESELRAIESAYHKQKLDLIDLLQKAQSHERRLSFQSGYS